MVVLTSAFLVMPVELSVECEDHCMLHLSCDVLWSKVGVGCSYTTGVSKYVKFFTSNRYISQYFVFSARRLVTRVANDACTVVREASWVML